MTDIFNFEAKTEHYAVMGNPINHSKSPLIHSEFAKQTKQNIKYDAIHVDLGGFTQAIRNFQANQGRGLNITVPFKIEAYKLADKLSQRAQRAGAVNTLIFNEDGSILGDNTDGYGLVSDLTQRLKWPVKNKNILLLGAGGAARGVLEPLLAEQPAQLFIANRTASRAKDLAEEFATLGNISGGSYGSLSNPADKQKTITFDIIINATSASLNGDMPPLSEHLLTPDSCCYDLMYSVQATIFMQWATQHGITHVADGLGMLVGQAAESFYLWRSCKPEVTAVIALIRQQLVP